MSVVAVRGVTVRFGSAEILHAVDLDVAPAEWVGLIGPNGAGKSTLLRAVAGLVPHEGTVELGGEPIRRLRRRAIARRVSMVAQEPLLPDDMRVDRYVLLGRMAHLDYLAREGEGDRRVVDRVLERLDLGPMADRLLGTLSGGERQRVVLARTLAQEAPILLLDEPTSALDIGRQQQALDLIADLRAELGLTIVAAMHDLTLAGRYADRLVLLDAGRVVASGAPREVLTAEAISALYGAVVRVLVDDDGLAVVPVGGRG